MIKSNCWPCDYELLWKMCSMERKETKGAIPKVCELGEASASLGPQLFIFKMMELEKVALSSSSANIL